MADIPVEKKQRVSWIWWILGLLLLAGVVWIVLEAFEDDEDLDVAGVEEVEPGVPEPEPEAVDLGAILASPGEWVGETFPEMEVSVSSVPTDRGFWIAEGGDSLFAIIIDMPVEQPKDINPGQTLLVTGGVLHDSAYLNEVEGRELEQETRQIVQAQAIYLVVDEENIVIREAGTPQPGTDPAETIP